MHSWAECVEYLENVSLIETLETFDATTISEELYVAASEQIDGVNPCPSFDLWKIERYCGFAVASVAKWIRATLYHVEIYLHVIPPIQNQINELNFVVNRAEIVFNKHQSALNACEAHISTLKCEYSKLVGKMNLVNLDDGAVKDL